jgi:hypothetical protein
VGARGSGLVGVVTGYSSSADDSARCATTLFQRVAASIVAMSRSRGGHEELETAPGSTPAASANGQKYCTHYEPSLR